MWTVNKGNNSTQLKLSLSACPEGSFNCDDGVCIELARKCDSSSDCQDNSDEKNCTILLFSSDYSKDIIPIQKHDDQTHSQSSISIGLSIWDILDIDINSGKVRLKLGIMLEWIDPRLDFLNLKSHSSLNTLNSNESGLIWKPDIIYVNKEPSDYYVNVEPEISIRINNSIIPKTLDWNPYMATEYLYAGETNPLQWSTVIRYICYILCTPMEAKNNKVFWQNK